MDNENFCLLSFDSQEEALEKGIDLIAKDYDHLPDATKTDFRHIVLCHKYQTKSFYYIPEKAIPTLTYLIKVIHNDTLYHHKNQKL